MGKPPLHHSIHRVAPLLFGSGFCALIYQIGWTRELRLTFGASTAATSAVIAIFIGGLGLGGFVLGKRNQDHMRPLALYANLETIVAIAAALSPFSLWVAGKIYIASGGTQSLGQVGSTALRLVLATLVLFVPTFFMGGTLPAAAQAVTTDRDAHRTHLAWLYGVNTLGAVLGCLLSNFLLLEVFGTKLTLWIASLINLLVAVTARAFARSGMPASTTEEPAETQTSNAPSWFVLAAAAIVGFAFFLMELVWYRMLGPILGGTVFTFGLILAVALLGIGLGGAAYTIQMRKREPTLFAFGVTCLLEAALIAAPYALGDRVAILALLLRPVGAMGFGGFILGWFFIATVVVFPAAFISGLQFPLLIALLGRGTRQIGRQVGLTYAWNTIGAILGALAGGFGLIPLLTAPTCWRLVAWLLALLGTAACAVASVRGKLRWALLAPAAIIIATIFMLRAEGPTAAWRHSPIGAGRLSDEHLTNSNSIRELIHTRRRMVTWQVYGVESSVALAAESAGGLSFLVNGKNDGNSTGDAATQVMSGLVGALLHPNAKQSLVIGLGTGSSAGWLGAVPTMDHVEVVELEPRIVHVARVCAPINADVLNNPKVHITFGDAREVLLTSRNRYDIIFSEPSNPYRAGVASLFTRDYYAAAADRLNPDGLFLQWVQGYEVDTETIRSLYATVASVFPVIETWQLRESDLLLVATRHPLRYNPDELRRLIYQEPFRSALANAWQVTSLEGFFGHYVARPSFATTMLQKHKTRFNTDDENFVEFGFARSVGEDKGFSIWDMIEAARKRDEARPELTSSEGINWELVEDHRAQIASADLEKPRDLAGISDQQRLRNHAISFYLSGNFDSALEAWRAQPRTPANPMELGMVAELFAQGGDEIALKFIDELRALRPAEADASAARLHLRQGNLAQATQDLESAYDGYRKDPWPSTLIMYRALATATDIARMDRGLGERLFAALATPFSTMALNPDRLSTRLEIAKTLDRDRFCREALEPFEPNIPWTQAHLTYRRDCYDAIKHPSSGKARDDLLEFLEHAPSAFVL